MIGRNTKLTKKLIEQFEKHRERLPAKYAAIKAGISERTYHYYRSYAEELLQCIADKKITKSDLTASDRLHLQFLQSANDASSMYRLNLHESMAIHAFPEYNEEGEITKKPNFHVTKYLAGIEKPEGFADPNALLQKQIQEEIQQQLSKALELGVIQVPASATASDFMNAALQQQNTVAQKVADSQSQKSKND